MVIKAGYNSEFYLGRFTRVIMADFPIDIEIIVEGTYVVCYETSISVDNQIRFENYSGSEVYSDDELFED